MTTARLVLALVIGVGCNKDQPSSGPRRIETHLSVPGYDHEHQFADHAYVVIAALTLPGGYELVPNDSRLEFVRGRRDSSGYVEPLWPNMPAQYAELISSGTSVDDVQDVMARERDPSLACLGEGDHLVRHEPRPDGDVVVCGRDAEDITEIWRTSRWRDQYFKCRVMFGATAALFTSGTRVEDAIAICDSFSVREATQADLERFFPPDADGKWHVPKTR